MSLSEIIEKSVQVISNGGVILYPTDTIWGLGGDATNNSAIDKIYKIKKRPDSKSLVSLVSDLKMLKSLTEVSIEVQSLLDLSDKPTTIIYNNVKGINSSALANDGSAAIRIPDHEFCKRLISRLGHPLISTSANMSGTPSPVNFSDISEEIKSEVDFVVPLEADSDNEQIASRILKISGKDIIVIRE